MDYIFVYVLLWEHAAEPFFLFYKKIENIFNWRDDIVVIAASSRYLSYSNADKALPFRLLLALFLENTHRIEVGTDEEVARRSTSDSIKNYHSGEFGELGV